MKMKKIILACLSIVIAVTLTSAISENNCDSKTLKKESISELNPFYYSASKVNVINYDYKPYRKEIEVPLFKGEKYKMVFNKKGLPKDVLIEIFDKDKSHEHRHALFTSKGNEAYIVSYTPQKSKKHYVRYTVPEGKDIKEGCIVFVLGYQLTFIKEETDTKKEEEEK